MKLVSWSDVITNSSTEVWVIPRDQWKGPYSRGFHEVPLEPEEFLENPRNSMILLKDLIEDLGVDGVDLLLLKGKKKPTKEDLEVFFEIYQDSLGVLNKKYKICYGYDHGWDWTPPGESRTLYKIYKDFCWGLDYPRGSWWEKEKL